MSGAEVLAGIGLLGTGVSVAGQLSAASAQAEAAKKNAELKQQQAVEIEQRNAINEEILSEQFDIAKTRYGTLAQSGSETVGGLVKMISDFEKNKEIRNREVAFKTKMLRAGAEQDLTLSSDIATSGTLGAAGTILTGAGTVYDRYNKYSSSYKG